MTRLLAILLWPLRRVGLWFAELVFRGDLEI